MQLSNIFKFSTKYLLLLLSVVTSIFAASAQEGAEAYTSPNGEYRAELLNSKRVLKIQNANKTWDIGLEDWERFERVVFLSNNLLLITRGNLTTGGSEIISLDTKKSVLIGRGSVKSAQNGIIHLTNQKYYLPPPNWGAFWVDSLVDYDGNILKFIEPNSKYLGECISIKLILDQEPLKEHPKLQQSLSDCVRVVR